MIVSGEGWGKGIVREFGMDMYTLLYLKWITNKDPLSSTGNSAQCCVAAWMGGEFRGESVQFSCSVMSDSLRPHGLQHARLLCPSPTPRVCSNSGVLSQWCHSIIVSSVIPFSSCLQSFPASGSFPMSQFFTSGGQSIGVSASASVHPMNIQDWFPLGLTGLIGGEWIHVYVWLSPFASTWNYHNTVNQLYSKVK